jgi:Rod binding domain-containing protein
MDTEMSKSISRTSSMGIAEMLYKQLSKSQTRSENG